MYITILNLFQIMIGKYFDIGYLSSADDVIMQTNSCLHCLGCLHVALKLSVVLSYYSHCQQLIPHVQRLLLIITLLF